MGARANRAMLAMRDRDYAAAVKHFDKLGKLARADDGQGGQCSGEVFVGVPDDQGKKGSPAVDGGPLYDSTQ